MDFWTVGCVDGYSGPRGSIFWSIKMDLFFIVNSNFWVTILVDLEEAWIFGLYDVWMGIQDLEDRYLG